MIKDSYTQGNGLGLSICKGIVEAHSGVITAYSDGENCGSRFKIVLPQKHTDKNSGTVQYEKNSNGRR